MEVHHHAHTARKKWTHYLWEFLMLFLAVFCGFLAENLREHVKEIEKGKQYIKSLMRDLEDDENTLRRRLNRFDSANKYTDTLILLLKSKERNFESCKIYNLGRIIPFYYGAIEPKDQTFQQLKSSGNLRLIHNNQMLDSIGSYYQQYISLNNGGPGQMLFQNRHDVYLFTYELFDMLEFDKVISSDSLFAEFHNLDSCEGKPALLSNDPIIINKVCARYYYLKMSAKIIIRWVKGILQRADSLLGSIKREYNLD